jgi:hypothetical protein
MNTNIPSPDDLSAAMLGDFRASTIARLVAGDDGNHPVVVVDGDQAPTMAGDGYYWTTPGGTLIRHPNAYQWAKVYHASTRIVEVGAGWIVRMIARNKSGGAFRRDNRHGVTTAVLTGSRQTIHGCTADAGLTTDGRRVWIVTMTDGRSFHAARRCDLFADSKTMRADARSALREAVGGLRKQAAADRKWQADLGRALDAIWVDEAASRRSGNCQFGTEAAAKRIRMAIGDVGAVRADVLLSMRDDGFTRRAIAAAAHR